MSSLRSITARLPPGGWVCLLAAALLLPGLGAFGFWEPWEARVAAPGTRGGPLPPAAAAWLAAGAGGGEARARLVFALSGLAAVAACYWAGAGMFGRRPAALGAAVLVTMPLFSFQARQLLSDMPLVLGLALALGGLGRHLWAGGRALDLAVAGVGLALGWAAGGALVGVAVPCAAAAAALVAGGGTGTLRARRLTAGGLAAAAALIVALGLLRTHPAGAYSGLLGGVPRLGDGAPTFEWAVRQLGFGLFPFSGLAFFALGQPLVSADEEPAAPTAPRLYLLFFAGFGLALATARGYLVGEGRFAALAPIALAVGLFLDEQPERPRPERIVALLAGVGTILVARDLFLGPEELFSVHTLAKVRWPSVLDGGALLLAAGLAFAGAVWVAVGMRRRAGVWAALGVAVVLSALLTQGLVPALSRHLSPRALVEAYRRAATGGEPLARYQVEGEGASALRSAPGPALASPRALAAHLGGAGRAFAVVPAETLAPVHEALALASVPYAVLDASSSRLLLVTNRLAPGEADRNPLRRHVFLPAAPGERPPWPAPRVARTTVFADAVELLGADFPTTVRRPGRFHLTLIFRVLRRPPPAHDIFVHLSRPGQPLVNGDHRPLGGTFPTAYWLPGQYLRDEHAVELPLAVTPPGTYELHVGLWPGGNRPGVAITAGETDGHHRAPLGTVEIR
jgi:4-amino-4-deoxy-L-arabinose transferase-like glycosyltransferase